MTVTRPVDHLALFLWCLMFGDCQTALVTSKFRSLTLLGFVIGLEMFCREPCNSIHPANRVLVCVPDSSKLSHICGRGG